MIQALRCLPGVGPKSAQRMAFQLLERKRDEGLKLADILQQAIQQIGHCEDCRTLSETTQCLICADPQRDPSQLCIVETPADVIAIEQTGSYRGYYFVLLGHLSPLDGIGPQNLGMEQLLVRLQDPALRELILATNCTVEGEATAHYIANLSKPYPLRRTRLAHGVPMGGELEYLDGNTLARALMARNMIEVD
ncbi:MAG: recombination protein RecR [Coxiellaceae bacterium]|nr:MAG: recombination protein RecR [Coxiellaceae bacterium]